MRLLFLHKLSEAGGKARALAKLPPTAAQITPAQPEALAAQVVTETASPAFGSYWPKYRAWADKLWEPTVMPWDQEGGGA